MFFTHSSATERDEWLEAIAKAIDDYTKKKITFISSRSQEEVKLKISVIDVPPNASLLTLICEHRRRPLSMTAHL